MNKFKFKLALVGVATTALLLPAAAQAQLSFNIGAVSLYKSNGVDQNWEENKHSKNFSPAIQGGVDYAFSNGFYVGNWNSTGKFEAADLEIDLYGGFRGELAKGLGFDVGFARYIYPSQASWNGNEVYVSLSYAAFSAKFVHGVRGWQDKHERLSFGYSQPLTNKLTFKAGLGLRNDKAGNFDDYSIGLGYDLGNALSLSASFAGATKKSEDELNRRDNRLVLGVSKSF